MDTIYMNSENRKTSDPHRLILIITDKINLKGGINIFLYQILTSKKVLQNQ